MYGNLLVQNEVDNDNLLIVIIYKHQSIGRHIWAKYLFNEKNLKPQGGRAGCKIVVYSKR